MATILPSAKPNFQKHERPHHAGVFASTPMPTADNSQSTLIERQWEKLTWERAGMLFAVSLGGLALYHIFQQGPKAFPAAWAEYWAPAALVLATVVILMAAVFRRLFAHIETTNRDLRTSYDRRLRELEEAQDRCLSREQIHLMKISHLEGEISKLRIAMARSGIDTENGGL